MKMPTIVGIFIFISREHFMLSYWAKIWNMFYNLGAWFLYASSWLIFTALLAYAADNKLTRFCLFFPENRFWHFIFGRQFKLNVNVYFLVKIKKKINRSSAENFTQHAKLWPLFEYGYQENRPITLIPANIRGNRFLFLGGNFLRTVLPQLAFYVNLQRAVIGPSATLTGR